MKGANVLFTKGALAQKNRKQYLDDAQVLYSPWDTTGFYVP